MLTAGVRASCALGGLLALTACASTGDRSVPVAPFPAASLAVVHGGELQVRHARSQRVATVRLDGIHAPAPDQPHGPVARQALASLVVGRSLVVSAMARDEDGALVARVCVAEDPWFTRWAYPSCETERSVNRALVAAGHAWAVPGRVTDEGLIEAQRQARVARTGLWADASPVPPWQWRELSPEMRSAILLAQGSPTPPAGPATMAPGEDLSWLFATPDDPAAVESGSWRDRARTVFGGFF